MAAPSTLRNRKHHRQTLEGDASTIQEDALESIIISDSPVSSSSSKVIPLTQRPLLFRLDVGPFLLLYTALIACDILWQKDHGDDVRFMITVGLSVSLLMQLSLVLASTWSVSVQSTVGYARSPLSETSAIQHWTHAFIELEDDQLGIVAIEIDPILKIHTCKFHETVFHCDVQHRNLDQKLWTTNNSDNVQQQQGIQQPAPTAAAAAAADQALFQTRNYPIHLPLSFYSSWTGHASMESITKASIWYGLNQCLLEPPTFAQLLSQQVVAPFFLFQLFCVGLWCLDEYWYYAIYTLIALLLFESTVAYQRLASLQKLRRAGNHEGRVYCQRMIIQSTATATAAATAASNHSPKRQWIQLSTKELVPGDIVSLCATNRVYGTSSYTVPADILLLCGTAVCDEALLTGESVPQLKHALEINGKEDELLDIQDNEHKESILFAGTTLIATTNNKESDTDSNSNSNSNNTHIFSVPPDRGTVGMVLRTGFETTQGALLRTMAFSSKSADGVHTWDTFIFIFLLVCCAIAAAAFVLHNGWYDERRNRFRLLLHVVIIITSVVPPELPMELSLAVTNSVAALMQRCQVYCTEHFRIPWAGEVDVCCFDKTGTLTSDEMQLKGVCLQKDNAVATDLVKLKDAEDADENANESVLPWETLRVMVACHSLGTIGTGSKLSPITVVGDPLEKTVLKESGYRLVGDDTVARSDDAGLRKGARAIRILHRFAFSSKLKRMTTLATEEGGRDIVFALSKGAPETIKELLKSVPDEYDETARFHMSKGRRVLAMAYREAGHIHNLSKLKGLGRDELEKDLVFAGFLILDCPLKPDSKAVVTELRKSGHSVIMCTGDALLTAVEVARQVSIVKRKHKIHKIQLKARDGEMSSDVLSNFECVALDEKGDATSFCLSPSAVHQMTDMMGEASFCITGDVLVQLASVAVLGGQLKRHKMDEKHTLLHPDAQSVLSVLVPLISIFARHAPHHKEAVIAALNFGGHRTLMCGDGTNDVGALKRATVGISIISAPDIESKQREATDNLNKTERKGKTGKGSKQNSESLRRLREAEALLDEVELGDASVAAPFTSRAVSIRCCKDVIQQGRCTLVTMLSIYMILGINCLVNAMVLSKLFLNGVKQGDRQMTILGVAVTALFYFVTRAEPLTTLANVRPPSSVMCLRPLLSILLQCAIHCVGIVFTTNLALSFVDPFDPSLVPDGAFNANPLNTTTFLFTCLATVNTFAANYRGRPFMADLKENKLFYRSLQLCYGTLLILVLEAFPPLNDLFQLSSMPVVTSHITEITSLWSGLVEQLGFQSLFGLTMVIDTVLVYLVARMLR